jgi:ABC-type nitrate/sulfonate/bicarbonate transport system substrate-binding protein
VGSQWRPLATTVSLILLTLVAACSVPESARPATPVTAPAASGAAPLATPAALTPVRMVATFTSGELGPIWLALETGAFARQGLAVENLTVMTPATAYAALLANEVDVVVGTPSTYLPSIASGADFVVVAAHSNSQAYVIMAQPGIGSIGELQGKVFAVARPPGSETYLGQQALSTRGLESGRDYELRQIGGQGERFTALQAGAADFTVLSPPASTRLRRDGFGQLANLAEENIAYIGVGLNLRRSFIDAHPDTVERLVRAYIEGIWKYRSDPALTLEVLRRRLDVDDMEVLDETYAAQLATLEDVPYARAEAILPAIEFAALTRPELREITPAQISDSRFVQRAEASGYIRQVTGR